MEKRAFCNDRLQSIGAGEPNYLAEEIVMHYIFMYCMNVLFWDEAMLQAKCGWSIGWLGFSCSWHVQWMQMQKIAFILFHLAVLCDSLRCGPMALFALAFREIKIIMLQAKTHILGRSWRLPSECF